MTAQFQVYEGFDRKFRWHLIAANGEAIASSPGGQSYPSKSAADNGIQSVKTNAPDATVVQLAKPPTAPKSPQQTPHEIAIQRQIRLNGMRRQRRQPMRLRSSRRS
jgi:uncharacterized protein